MTTTLLILGFLAATNPARVAAAAPARPQRALLATFVATYVSATLAAAWLSGPLLQLVDVTDASARIAAGIALLAVAIKDIILRPARPEPALAGNGAGAIPLAFPVAFSPAVALMAIASAADRGVAVTLGCATIVALVAAAATRAPAVLRARPAVATIGIGAAGVAALVVLDGVYAI